MSHTPTPKRRSRSYTAPAYKLKGYVTNWVPHIAVGSDYGIGHLCASLEEFGGAEVCDLNSVAGTDENVGRLEISVQHFAIVQIAQADSELKQPPPNDGFLHELVGALALVYH